MRKHRVDRTALCGEISTLLRKLVVSQTAMKICKEETKAPQEEFLLKILKCEMANHEEVHRAHFLREAAFPVYKTFEGFDFSFVKLLPVFSKQELMTAAFVAEKRNLVLYGPVGTGGTHLSTALGVAACFRSFRTRFFTAAGLVWLSEASKEGMLDKLLISILKADLLIVDEWDYVPVDRQRAQLLSRVISDPYERRSVIITTNLKFSKWGTIFTDDQMAAAIIDRLAHHRHILLFEGESYRMKHALMRQSGADQNHLWLPGEIWRKPGRRHKIRRI